MRVSEMRPTIERLVGALAIAWGITLPAAGQTVATFTVGSEAYSIDRYPAKAGTTKLRVIVLLHGVDGMTGSSGKQIGNFAEQLANDGFLVVVPHYFDKNDGGDSLEAFQTRLANLKNYGPRVAAAVDYATGLADADGTKLGLVGFSLGGGLALEYAESKPAGTVKGVVDFFGYIGDSSIYSHVDKLPPTLVLHNKKDGIVPIQVSKDLVAALDKTTVVHDHKYYDDGNPEVKFHPFLPDGKEDKDSRMHAIEWLKTHVK